MSEGTTHRQTAVNFNTVLLFVLLGVFGWLCVTTLETSKAMIRMEAIVQNLPNNFPSRVELETKLNEVNAAIVSVRARVAEIEMMFRRERPTTTPTTTRK